MLLTQISLVILLMQAACGSAGVARTDPIGDTRSAATRRGPAPAPAPTAPAVADAPDAITLLRDATRCVDVRASDLGNGAPAQLWGCNGTPAQTWTLADGQIRALGNRCLDVTDGVNGNGTRVQLWDCTPGNVNQQWQRNGSSFVWAAGGRCLDLPGGVVQDGTPLQIWDCNGSSAQAWSPAGNSAPAPTPAPAPSPTPTPTPAPPPTGAAPAPSDVQAELALINGDRASLGLPPLALDAALSASASAHDAEMSTGLGLTHATKYGSFDARMRAFGATFNAAAENIAWGSAGLSPETANKLLFTDEAPTAANNFQAGGHYENITGPYTRVGIAYANGYWTMDFAN
jgi:uncharacterized protein YkwD